MEAHFECCPHCGKKIDQDPRFTYTFRKWGTPALILLVSFMLFALDFTIDGKYEQWSLDWAHWAVLGVWTFYIPVQLLRSSPNYGWIITPIGGILFIFFFFFLDRLRGKNEGFLGLDWAWPVIIPIFTFIVAFPIVSHNARKELTHLDQLEFLVESLAKDSEI